MNPNIIDIYSKRQQRLRGEVPDVYQYEDIPEPLRVQVVYIVADFFDPHNFVLENIYSKLLRILCEEYGVLNLINDRFRNHPFIEVLLSPDNLSLPLRMRNYTEIVLDIIEIVFKSMESVISSDMSAKAILKLNERFKEHSFGFAYRNGQIIRIDSELVHAEVVKPVLFLLSDLKFKGANEEFLKAHEHYRHGKYKECLNECLKSFESTLKTICNIRRWQYNQNDTAKKLIDICLMNGLIPQYLQSQFAAVRTILESGVPTIRNRLGGHGQGTQQITVSQNMASYMLHLTATNLLFIIEAEKNLP
ncbi:STM4504/CBY_0614 family protein [Pseudanabaena sp. PCC 6802]|uniref:STM4504/CBY_0614 family protein n=1 Tax=Pseudanabaena sp. PCC 6802 TaxID=118173 RepID=UPI00034DA725|nr:hypothetical protein [Pseudanabaena sp. PCC 6802]